LGQRDIAAPGAQFCRIQCMPVFGFLRLMLKFTGLPEGRKLSLLGLIEEIIGFGQAADIERIFR
jgi:hypothetical protein